MAGWYKTTTPALLLGAISIGIPPAIYFAAVPMLARNWKGKVLVSGLPTLEFWTRGARGRS